MKHFPKFLFEIFFEVSGKSHSVSKSQKCKKGSLRVFEHTFFAKWKKLKGDPLETKNAKKVSQSRNKIEH